MVAGGPFGVLLGNLNSLGFFQFLFPFLLVLAIVYGVLEFAMGGQGGEKGKRILPKSANALISIIIAFFFINFSGGVGAGIAVFFSQLFGGGMIVAVAILVVLILIGLFGIRPDDLHGKDKPSKGVAAIAGVVILIVFSIFVWSGNAIPGLGNLRLDQSSYSIIAFVVILIIVMWALTKEGGEKKGG